MKYKLSFVLVLILLLSIVASASAAQQLFQPYVSFLPIDGKAVGIGDFNGDGLNDVAMTTGTQLLVYTQNSAGQLGSPVSYGIGGRAESLAVGDLNHDGRSDIVTANFSSNNIGVYLQQADGTLAPAVFYTTSTGPDAVAVGDLNGDGWIDVAVAHWNAPVIGVLTQTSAGTLNAMVTYASPQAGYDDVAVGDVNSDGRSDVVKMNGQGLNPNLSVYVQNAQGTLSSAQSYSIANCSYCLSHGVDTGDVTGDGRTDIVVSYGGNIPDAGIAVFAQASNGSLQPATNYPAYHIPEPVEVADVNADGLADVLTVHGGWNSLGIFLQQNSGLSPYTLYTIPYATHYKPEGFDVGDINNDGLPDLAIADYNHGLVVLYHTSPDVTLPMISVTAVKQDGSPYIAGTWTNQTVTVKYTCSDTGSGIASCPANQVFSADGVTALATGTVSDNAGNSASASFGPIKIDKTSPAFYIGVSPNPVLLNGTANLEKNANDQLSGIAPESESCSSIDTKVVGTKSVTCSISDYAGNRMSVTTQYQVIYDFEGFLSPLIDCVNNPCNSYQLSSYSVGSTVSVKFRLKDANGNLVLPAAAPLWLVPVKIDGEVPVSFPADYAFQTTYFTYTWRKSLAVYQYDWSTKRLPSRTNWLVGVKLDDGKTYYVFVYFK